jgi:hypothetical protein
LAAAIESLAADPAAAAAHAAAARQQAEPYAWAVQKVHYLAVVDGLLSRAAR